MILTPWLAGSTQKLTQSLYEPTNRWGYGNPCFPAVSVSATGANLQALVTDCGDNASAPQSVNIVRMPLQVCGMRKLNVAPEPCWFLTQSFQARTAV